MRIYNPWQPLGESNLYRLKTAYPASVTVNTGTAVSADVADVATIGGDNVEVTEVVDTPGFDIQFDWAGLVDVPRTLHVICYYEGGANHGPTIDVYDFVADAWVTLHTMEDMFGMRSNYMPVGPQHVEAGVMSVRFYHAVLGVGTHEMFVDYLAAEMWRE